MSEQAKILTELEKIIMIILENGAATVEESDRIEELEDLMLEQTCYTPIEHPEYTFLGEEIASLLSTDLTNEAIGKMCEWKITPDDFFGFIAYHDEEEVFVALFTDIFITEVTKVYQSKCPSK